MATIIDDTMAQAAVGTMLTNLTQVGARREVFAASDSEERLIESREIAGRRRQNYSVVSDLVLNRISSDQTGSDDVLSERTLSARSAQNQPQQGTYNDPNYRPGAAPPTAPPSPTKSS